MLMDITLFLVLYGTVLCTIVTCDI